MSQDNNRLPGPVELQPKPAGEAKLSPELMEEVRKGMEASVPNADGGRRVVKYGPLLAAAGEDVRGLLHQHLTAQGWGVVVFDDTGGQLLLEG